MMTITRAGVLSAFAATALLLAGCAGQQAPAAQVGAPGADTAQETYDHITTQVYGTTEQRQAAAEDGWLRTQIAVRDCMDAQGQQYTPAPYHALPAAVISPGDLLAFAAIRTDFGVGARITTLAAAGEFIQPALQDASDEQQKAYTAALNACAGTPAAAGDNPEGQEALDGQLVATLTEVQKKAAPDLDTDYPVCLDTHGVKAANLSDLYVKIEQSFPAISYEHSSDATKADGWATGAGSELDAAAADAACRKDVIPVAIAAAQPALETFADDNGSGLEALAARWAKAITDLPGLRAKVS